MADELAGEITALEDDLKAEMTARQVEELQIDIFKIRYKTVKSRRFDSKTFKSANEALYNPYSKEVVSSHSTGQYRTCSGRCKLQSMAWKSQPQIILTPFSLSGLLKIHRERPPVIRAQHYSR